MDFALNLDELVENFYLDGVYEEIISFDNITEALFQKTKEESFKQKMMEYLHSAV